MADLIDREELLCDVYTVKDGKPFPYKEAYKKMLSRIKNAPMNNAYMSEIYQPVIMVAEAKREEKKT